MNIKPLFIHLGIQLKFFFEQIQYARCTERGKNDYKIKQYLTDPGHRAKCDVLDHSSSSLPIHVSYFLLAKHKFLKTKIAVSIPVQFSIRFHMCVKQFCFLKLRSNTFAD